MMICIRFLSLLFLCSVLSACATAIPETGQSAMASFTTLGKPEQCVPYARRISGIQIRGDAWQWWGRAGANGYARGAAPMPGSVLVLSRTGKMTHGHVAVVKNVIGPREIDVTHSNWGNSRATRRLLYTSMRVEDISEANDWSRVRFWNELDGVFGFPYAASGFIYPRS